MVSGLHLSRPSPGRPGCPYMLFQDPVYSRYAKNLPLNFSTLRNWSLQNSPKKRSLFSLSSATSSHHFTLMLYIFDDLYATCVWNSKALVCVCGGFISLEYCLRVLSMLFLPFQGRIIFHSMDVPNFVHPSINGCLGCFHFLTIMNYAAINICM